jgi:hypothetical protein
MKLKFLDKVRFKESVKLPGIDHSKVYILLGIECDGFVITVQDKLGTCGMETWHANPEEFIEKTE